MVEVAAKSHAPGFFGGSATRHGQQQPQQQQQIVRPQGSLARMSDPCEDPISDPYV